jgi:hypothetical protein
MKATDPQIRVFLNSVLKEVEAGKDLEGQIHKFLGKHSVELLEALREASGEDFRSLVRQDARHYYSQMKDAARGHKKGWGKLLHELGDDNQLTAQI